MTESPRDLCRYYQRQLGEALESFSNEDLTFLWQLVDTIVPDDVAVMDDMFVKAFEKVVRNAFLCLMTDYGPTTVREVIDRVLQDRKRDTGNRQPGYRR